MAELSIFTDESSGFAHDGTMGLRYTVAVVLEGRSQPLNQSLHAILECAAGPFGMPFHASQAARAERLLPHLQKRLGRGERRALRDALAPMADSIQPVGVDALLSWIEQGERRRHSDAMMTALATIGGQIKHRTEQAVGSYLSAHGFAVLCFEFGLPSDGRWAPMMEAVLEEALVQVALRSDGPHQVELVVAENSNPNQMFHLAGALARLNQAAGHKLISEIDTSASVGVVQAAKSPGIQVADIIAYALRPQGKNKTIVTNPREETTDRLFNKTESFFGDPGAAIPYAWPPRPPAPHSEKRAMKPARNDARFTFAGAWRTHQDVNEAVSEMAVHGSMAAVGPRAAELRKQLSAKQAPLPHTLMASVQCATTVLDALAARLTPAAVTPSSSGGGR